jgi:hypothetical protein
MTTRDDDPTRKDDDTDLRSAFEALRREDAARAPSFEALLRKAPRSADRRRPWLVPAVTGAVAAAALTVAIVSVARRPEPRLPPPVSIEEWTAPTDFLLQTPGRELLETVPRIGDVPSMGPLDLTEIRGKRRSVSP